MTASRLLIRSLLFLAATAASSLWSNAADWFQYQHDAEHTGNAVDARITLPLKLVAAVPLTDAVFAAPAIADGRVFALDGSGVMHCLDQRTGDPIWTFSSEGGALNCNNYSSPAVIGPYVHFGTMGGNYYVLRADNGELVRRIEWGEPIFSCPVVSNDRVYCVTLGSRVFAMTPEGRIQWKWDFVHEVLKYQGDRWSGIDWLKHQKGKRVTWREQFLCSRNMAAHGKRLVVPAGGSVVWLEDQGEQAQLIARHAPNESPSTLGLSLDGKGTVYRQWFRRDNTGSIEVLKLVDRKVNPSFVPGTGTSWQGDDSMGFAAVSIRDGALYRCRPEQKLGLCRHENGKTIPMGQFPSIAPPVLAGQHVIVSGLDGRLTCVDLTGVQPPFSFATPFGRPITAPAAVSDGQIAFGGEDGYLYLLGPDGKADPPSKPLRLSSIRSPLTGTRTAAEHDWDAHFANQGNTNRTNQSLQPPASLRWIRRCEGTIKHLSTFGGGRMYTHTAEGQVMAVEQETGRLLWRRFFPGVHVSFTTPAYHNERLYVPQAGLKVCRLRCLDAATGSVVWEAPFSGSPSWNRQVTPVIDQGLIFYQFSTGKYTGRSWLFEHQSTFGFSSDQRPLLRAWDLKTGTEVWTRDFSEYGNGGDDAGICLANGSLFYSCYFGNKKNLGVTAALDPRTGSTRWLTTDYSVHAGCAPSVAKNRLYLGGYNPVKGEKNYVWCLDAATGQLVWKSDPVQRAIHVVTIAGDKLFTHAQYQNGYLLDAKTGHKLCDLTHGYRCTRFTMDGNYLLGPNMDMIDTSRDNQLVSTGPPVDVLQCVGAQISNGRMFYTANGSGLQLSLRYGKEASSAWTTD